MYGNKYFNSEVDLMKAKVFDLYRIIYYKIKNYCCELPIAAHTNIGSLGSLLVIRWAYSALISNTDIPASLTEAVHDSLFHILNRTTKLESILEVYWENKLYNNVD